MRARVEIEECEEGEGQEKIGETEVLEALDGAFEQMLLEQEGESIDDLEAGVMRLQYLAGRAAMARHLTAIAKKKLAQQESRVEVSSPMNGRTGSTAR
jgi:hypothetical protein